MGLCASSNQKESVDKFKTPADKKEGWHQAPPAQALYDGKQPPAKSKDAKPTPLVTAASLHPPGSHHEVLWFPDPALPCRHVHEPGGCRRGRNCNFSHTATNLSRFLDVLRSAQRTLDVCVYNITLDDISDLVIDLHKHGVKVRCISDAEQVSSTGSDIVRFRDAGIPVHTNAKVQQAARAAKASGHGGSSNWAPLMHHKFCIVDGKMLVNGSFNWSRSAVLNNWENIVVQDAPFLVQEYSKEFERLWKLFAT